MGTTLTAGVARREINPQLGTGKAGLRLFGAPIQAIPPAAGPVAPVAAPPPPVVQVQAAPASAGEPIVGIIGLQRRTGFMGMGVETFNMIVTPQRLAFVAVSNEVMKEAVNTAREQARAAGKGFFGQMGAQLAWMDVLFARYQAAPVDVTLAQSPGSFLFLNQQVSSIRLKDPPIVRIGMGSGNDQQNTRTEIVIEAGGGKHKFELLTMKARDARAILQQTLGGVVR